MSAASDDTNLDDALTRVANLETALRTSRTIGIALGVVMERLKLTEDEAFHLLSSMSNQRQRKLRDVASDIVYSGEIPDAPAPSRQLTSD